MTWATHTDGSPVHVWPLEDTIEHHLEGTGCPCEPKTEEVPREDGTTGVMISHNAMDGRPE
ncbi:hypothetical protein HYP71_gp059 [Arthrobacter phage KBurrousTX]|uniref:Uncharacterized protein n=1 Tax=Arthrobacter phage KBurrousTX TaxID=2315608 RepID=A0A386K8L3_9CAUD|nr:hypothetical protein HYP71_gp059 [Arthrobacter phage KBurrousTX]AYD81553.1 hypothetical protein KBurrousTX_59 [Arthrobacter phage KBurrousTX]